MRTLTAVSEVSRPTTPFVRLRGKWLEAHGIKPGSTVYVRETPEGIVLSAKPPAMELQPLEVIKAEYERLGISTERNK